MISTAITGDTAVSLGMLATMATFLVGSIAAVVNTRRQAEANRGSIDRIWGKIDDVSKEIDRIESWRQREIGRQERDQELARDKR